MLFEQWFRNHFLVHAPSIRPLLLLLDGHVSHYNPTFLKMAAEEGIIVFCLPPYTMHLLQSLDNGAFASLKGQWRHECQRFYAQNPGKILNRLNFMQVFHKAWVQGMTIANVTSCFRAVRVYPVDKSAPCHNLTQAIALPVAQVYHMCPSVPQGKALHNPHQHMLIHPTLLCFLLVR